MCGIDFAGVTNALKNCHTWHKSRNHEKAVDMLERINDSDFYPEVLNAGRLVLVNFWTKWSEECKRIRLLMEEMYHDHDLEDKLKIVEVDWEQNKELAREYEVHGVPTLLVFDDGRLTGRYSGVLTSEEVMHDLQIHHFHDDNKN